MRKRILILSWVLLLAFGSQPLVGQEKISPDGLNLGYIVELNGNLLLFGINENMAWDLWTSDGTATGTVKLIELSSGNVSASPYPLAVAGDYFFFSLPGETNGRELWKTDGTLTGTALVKDINPGPANSDPYHAISLNGLLYFNADDGVHGKELWRSDGTAEGTVLVDDIATGSSGSNPFYLFGYGQQFIFYARDAIHGQGIWTSDGTAEGTAFVETIHLRPFGVGPYPGANTSRPYFTNVGGTLFFSGLYRSWPLEYELWKTDGTAEGTMMVKDIFNFSGSFPAEMVSFNELLFFSAEEIHMGRELWTSDGTEAGTVLFKEFIPGWTDSNPENFTELNGALYFRVVTSGSGQELWKTDGTAAGTVLVKDINPGYAFSYPSYLTAANDRLFFSAFDYTNGYEPWLSDGTEEGTILIKDINPGVASSYPRDFTVVGGTLFFTATEGNNRYLWKYAPCAIYDIAARNQSDCYPIYNTYTQDLEITFSGAPEAGQLIVNGQPFSIGTSPQTITLAGLEADGQPVTVRAHFEEEDGCYFEAADLFTAPAPCNTPEEIIASMQAYIQSLIEAGILTPSGNGLLPQLDQILIKISQGKTEAAINQLQSFIQHLASLRDEDGVLSPEEAQPLLDGANAILNQLPQQGLPVSLRGYHPAFIELGQNFPNPFSEETAIPYYLPEEGRIVLSVYQLNGERAWVIVQGVQPAGHHQAKLDAGELPDGVYFYSLQAGGQRITKRMIILK